MHVISCQAFQLIASNTNCLLIRGYEKYMCKHASIFDCTMVDISLIIEMETHQTDGEY